MPRRRALTGAQLAGLHALPVAEPDLIRHWTLDRADLAAVDRRRGAHNRLGYALQLCAFRYPGRLLRPGEAIPEAALCFVAGQLQVGAGVLAAYAARPQTRREQLDALREAFGFRMFAPDDGRGLLDWLPVALATTSAQTVAAVLMDELRRRRVVISGPSTVERLIAAALAGAERHVAVRLTRDPTPAQVDALEALLRPKEGTAVSVLAWVRRPAGAPGHRALARLVERLGVLRALGLDPARAVCFHRLGRLRDRTAELQQHRASGLALVTAAIALWNSVYLGRALDVLRRSGEAVPDALLAHVAPLGWQHVNLTGDYLWGADDDVGPDGLRPLRGITDKLKQALAA